MKKVFLGGSRLFRNLNMTIRERADNIMSKGYLVLIGDANGADKAMQTYFAEKFYPHVIVFCSGVVCRNNIGKWDIMNVQTNRQERDFQYYTIKDKKMSEDADYGFMLWDGESKGTLNNIVNLLEQHKMVLVYFSPAQKYFTLKSGRDLINLLALCDRIVINKLEKVLKVSERINSMQSQLNFA